MTFVRGEDDSSDVKLQALLTLDHCVTFRQLFHAKKWCSSSFKKLEREYKVDSMQIVIPSLYHHLHDSCGFAH